MICPWLRLELDADEYRALEAMRAAGGFHSDADTLRAALWKYGLHFNMDLPIAVFRLRDGKPTVKRQPTLKGKR